MVLLAPGGRRPRVAREIPVSEIDRRCALWNTCSAEGGWPRLPMSRRHSADAWNAYQHLVLHGLAKATGNVRGDRTEFRATDRGRSLLDALRAMNGKPRIRIHATAHEMEP